MFEIRERFLEIFLRGVCSWKSNRFAFDKTSFDTWWVTGSVMCVLKCFSRFIVNFYVKDSVFLESFSFVNNRVKECDFLVWNSAVNFIVGRKLFACSRNKSTSCLSMSHRDVPLSMKRFHTVGFYSALAQYFCFDVCHENVGKSYLSSCYTSQIQRT